MEELIELEPTILTSEMFTVGAAFTGLVCLTGEEGLDWVALIAKREIDWCCN